MKRLLAFLTVGAGTLGTIGTVLGIGSSARNLFGGGGSSHGGSSAYVPTGQYGADQAWQQLQGLLTGATSGNTNMVNPQLVNAYANLLGIDTSQLAPAGAAAGRYYNSLASNVDAMHNNLVDQGNQIGAAGRAVWNTAQDPQNALYNRTLGQVQQQSRAADSARGIAMSPVSAGLENQATGNFNIDWQNAQLGRQLAGLQGMGGAFNQAGRDYAGGAAMGALAPQYLTQGAMTPFSMAQTAAGWPIQASNMFSGALQNDILGPLSGSMASLMPYLNFGQTASQNAFGQGQTNLANLAYGLGSFGQNPQMGNIWSTLGNVFSQPQQQGGGYTGANYDYNPMAVGDVGGNL